MSEKSRQLWSIRFKDGRVVCTGVVEASDVVEAEAVGRCLCAQHGGDGWRFIQIDGPFVLAGPEILKSPAPASAEGEPTLEKPSIAEQRERLQRRPAEARVGA